MNKHINPALARASSIVLTLVAVTIVPAMVAVFGPANTALAPQESHIVGPGRHFGTDYTANPLHLPPRELRDEIE